MKKMMRKFVCWFSYRFWDIHDYPDGKDFKEPMHWYKYECDRCGKNFYI